MALLAPDVVLVTDGGGIKRAALRPIHGPEKVVRWLVGVLNRPDYTGETRVEVTRLNDETAILLYADDELDTVAFLHGRGPRHHGPLLRAEPGQARAGHRQDGHGGRLTVSGRPGRPRRSARPVR